MKIAIISSTFYQEISKDMVKIAKEELDKNGYKAEIFNVIGAYDVPAALSMVINSNKFDGAICLGCVIKGETEHFHYVCNEVSAGINTLARNFQFPVGFGIITANNKMQADERIEKVAKNAYTACMDLLKIKLSLND